MMFMISYVIVLFPSQSTHMRISLMMCENVTLLYKRRMELEICKVMVPTQLTPYHVVSILTKETSLHMGEIKTSGSYHVSWTLGSKLLDRKFLTIYANGVQWLPSSNGFKRSYMKNSLSL